MKVQSISAGNTPHVSFESLLEKMLPRFRYYVRNILRYRADNFDDAVQELVTLAYTIYRSLVEQGKAIFYSPIVKFAIGRYKEGRRFIGYNSTDVLSEGTKALGRTDVCNGDTLYFLFSRQDVAHSVEFRLDFDGWLQRQTLRDKKIIRLLIMGENPSTIAKRVGVTPATITYSRRRYSKSWKKYLADDRDFLGQTA